MILDFKLSFVGDISAFIDLATFCAILWKIWWICFSNHLVTLLVLSKPWFQSQLRYIFNLVVSAEHLQTLQRWVCWTSKSAQQSVTLFIAVIALSLITPKAVAVAFVQQTGLSLWSIKANETEAGLNKRSCLAAALGVTKFVTAIAVILVRLCCAT
jgi:hypothetical protein